MPPGLATSSRRAAMLTPSPIRSPSASSTTSPTWTPIRNSIRRSFGTPALRSIMPFCTSTAQRTASTTLRNSTRAPSPVRFTTRPAWTAMVGSTRSLRRARRRASVRSSSVPASRDSDDVGGQNRGELTAFLHCASQGKTRRGWRLLSVMPSPARPAPASSPLPGRSKPKCSASTARSAERSGKTDVSAFPS